MEKNMKRSVYLLLVLPALFLACSGSSDSTPHGGDGVSGGGGGGPGNGGVVNAGHAPDALKPLASFEVAWDSKSQTFHVRTFGGKSLLTEKAADTLSPIPASSTGVPAGGGVVAFSPTPGTSS